MSEGSTAGTHPPRTDSGSLVVGADPAAVFALVSDVTRTGEWSPVCRTCAWDDGDAPEPGAAPRVGAGFTGRNVKPERTWETHSTVTASDPGRRFAWEVGEGYVAWTYDLQPHAEGTLLTETWEFRPAGIARFQELYGAEAEAQITARTRDAHDGIPATLAAIARVVAG